MTRGRGRCTSFSTRRTLDDAGIRNRHGEQHRERVKLERPAVGPRHDDVILDLLVGEVERQDDSRYSSLGQCSLLSYAGASTSTERKRVGNLGWRELAVIIVVALVIIAVVRLRSRAS
jgi:hypothetical protein